MELWQRSYIYQPVSYCAVVALLILLAMVTYPSKPVLEDMPETEGERRAIECEDTQMRMGNGMSYDDAITLCAAREMQRMIKP
jgi:ferric-dicitrate binding protein FerR (iron transport regulator)